MLHASICLQNNRQRWLPGYLLVVLPMRPMQSCHFVNPLMLYRLAFLGTVGDLWLSFCAVICAVVSMQGRAKTACAPACKNADLVQSAPVLSLQICQIPNIIGNRQGCRRATSAVCPLEQRLCHYQITSRVVLYKSGVPLMTKVAIYTVCPPSACYQNVTLQAEHLQSLNQHNR